MFRSFFTAWGGAWFDDCVDGFGLLVEEVDGCNVAFDGPEGCESFGSSFYFEDDGFDGWF